mgnify:CR=1 FL=1|tara:strand:- start:271 stop:780 length:510 start_codon:yes stop_codon:yes gene_type:complete
MLEDIERFRILDSKDIISLQSTCTMGKSLYATVRIIKLAIYAPNKKEYSRPLFYIDTYGLVSSSSHTFNLKLSRKFFEKYATELPANKLSHIRTLIERKDEIRKEFLDDINAKLYPKSPVHVVFSELKCGDRMIEFMNEIGDQGWDTSGQLPSTNDGPTYVTMMRKRIP